MSNPTRSIAIADGPYVRHIDESVDVLRARRDSETRIRTSEQELREDIRAFFSVEGTTDWQRIQIEAFWFERLYFDRSWQNVRDAIRRVEVPA